MNLSKITSTLTFLLCLAAPDLSAQIPAFEHAIAFSGSGPVQSRNVQIDASGNIFTTGQFEGTADFDGNSNVLSMTSTGFEDIYIEKTDPSGTLLWAVSIGGVALDDGTGLVLDAQGNPILVGGFDMTVDFDPGPGTAFRVSTGDADGFVLKLDGANGNFMWVKTFGGALNDYAEAVAIDPFGHLFIVGNFEGTADFDPGQANFLLTSAGGYDVFVLHLDSQGDFEAAVSFEGLDSSDELGYAIAVDDMGSVLITGGFLGTVDFDPGAGTSMLNSAGGNDIFLLRLDYQGNLIYARAYGGPSEDYGFDIEPIGDGELYIAGGYSAGASFDGGTTVAPFAGGTDCFLARVDSFGQIIWLRTFGGDGWDYVKTLAVDPDSSTFCAGPFTSTIDLDPDSGDFDLVSQGGDDVFLTRFDPNGSFTGGHAFGGTGDDVAEELAAGVAGDLCLVGTFNGTVDFDFGAGNFPLSSPVEPAAYVLIMRTVVGMEEPSLSEWKLFPNPCAEQLYVEVEGDLREGEWEVLDLRGVVVERGDFQTSRFELDLTGIPSGMYVLRIMGDGKMGNRRFLRR